MLHGVHKIKFRKGRDANRSLVKKTLTDFIRYGKMEVTVKKAKVMRAVIDRVVHKAQRNTNSDKTMLLKVIGDTTLIATLTNDITPRFVGRSSGFVTVKRLGRRLGDGAEMARVEWVIKEATKSGDKDVADEPDSMPPLAVTDSKKKTVVARIANSTKLNKKLSTAPRLAKSSAVKKRGDR